MTLRDARPSDAEAIADIWYSGWQDGHLGFVPDELIAVRTQSSFLPRALDRIEQTMVALVAGSVAGFVTVIDDEVEQVYLSREHRGSGVADLLMSAAEQRIAANGHDRAWLAVVAGNARARAFYERRGWTDNGPFTYNATAASGPVEVPAHRYGKHVGPT